MPSKSNSHSSSLFSCTTNPPSSFLSSSHPLSLITMNGYSKMRVSTNSMASSKSRSMDLTNLDISPPHEDQEEGPKPQPDQQMAHNGQGNRFGVMLSRNVPSSASATASASASASQRFRRSSSNDNKSNASGSGTLQAAVRRAFSMRKSNSVGDGYWRIHDTGDVVDADADADQVIQEEEAEEEEPTTTTTTTTGRNRIKKRGNIFRACKRFFKF